MRKSFIKKRALILFTFVLFGFSTQLAAQKVSLNYSKQSLRTVLNNISRQTGLSLAYSKEVVNLDENVSINVKDAELSDVMTQLLSSRNLTYEIKENKIFIVEDGTSNSKKASTQNNANNLQVQGIITDEKGLPIIGANVSVLNSSIGTITDFNGKYSLSVPKGSTIKISYIGYTDQTRIINNPSTFNIQLSEDVASLSELIVVGYGVMKKSVVTAAISRVTSDELNSSKPSRVEDALKGKVSGVQITQSSGQPGSDSKFRIRGIGTVNNSDPLFIVDGMPVDGGIDYLNPVDIQSVEILKDAASAAIYGARAANGVVLVTTKNGTSGKTSINYNFSYGFQNPWKKKSVLDATEYMIIMNESLLNDGNALRYTNDQISAAGKGTDWQDETFNYNAPVQSHQISVSGGTDKSQYFLSLGYFDQQGIVGGNYGKSNYNRWSVRTNSTHTIFEDKSRTFLNKLRVGVNIGYSRTISSGIEANSEYGSILGSALSFSPLLSVYADEATSADILSKHPNAVTDRKTGQVFSTPPAGFQEIANPVAMLNQRNSSIGNSDKFVSTFWGELSVLPDLKFKSSYGVDLSFWGNDGYTFPYFLATQGKTQDFSTVSSEMNRGFKWQVENTLTYNKTFGDVHNIAVVLGQSAQKYTYRNLGGNDRDLLETDPIKANINAAIADSKLERVWGGTGGYTAATLASYFGRLDYNFDERYIFQATVRRDGSSNFGPANKWAVFPALSLGWNVTNENFMEDRPSWIDAVKLRFSWGKNGNERIGGFRYTSLMDGGQNYYFGGGYQVNPGDPAKVGETTGSMQYGSSPASIPNPNVKWEESEQTDIGFETYLFKSALSFSFDYFKKTTNGMLMEQPIPSYVGQGSPIANVGDMQNWGLEFELGWKQKIGDFKYGISANASYLQNKLIKLGNASGEQIYENAGASGVGSYVKGQNGFVFPFYYGFKTDGIFQNQAEIDAYVNSKGEKLQPAAQPGDVRFVNFNNDDAISDADKTKIGKGMPDWTYGLTLNSEWKNFDLNLFFQGTIGNDVYDFSQRGDIPAMNRPSWILNRWHGEGTSYHLPRMTNANPNSNWRSSDLYIKDGSYLRLKSSQLGYTLPQKLTRSFSVEKLRLFVLAENLLTLTKYNGFDPEVASGGYTTIGIDRGVYPQARTISLGASIIF